MIPNRFSRIPQAAVLGALLLTTLPLIGCGNTGAQMAPVSGTVTVNGQPQADVVVSFMPTGKVDVGAKGSSGKTDAQGRFTLKTIESDTKQGAAIGTHKVMIRPYTEGRSEDEPASNQPEVKLPAKATDGSLTFEVLAGGTDQADFAL